MASPTSLSWAMRPDPVMGTRIVALWTLTDGSSNTPVEMLEIDLMGRSRHIPDPGAIDWIPIPDDAPGVALQGSEQPLPIRPIVFDRSDPDGIAV